MFLSNCRCAAHKIACSYSQIFPTPTNNAPALRGVTSSSPVIGSLTYLWPSGIGESLGNQLIAVFRKQSHTQHSTPPYSLTHPSKQPYHQSLLHLLSSPQSFLHLRIYHLNFILRRFINSPQSWRSTVPSLHLHNTRLSLELTSKLGLSPPLSP